MYDTTSLTEEQKSAVPDPKGYKVLVAIPKVEEATKGGILLPDDLRDREQNACVVGYVVSLGDLAYKSTPRRQFGETPWCKEGDYVIFAAYSGTKIMIAEQEFRLINDDTVQAVVDDPRKIVRGI